MIQYWDNYYKCSVINLEDNLMQIGEKVIIKHEDKVIECRVFKMNDLSYGSSDEIVLIDERGNEYTRKFWQINKLTKSVVKELDPDNLLSTEIKYDPIENESEELDD